MVSESLPSLLSSLSRSTRRCKTLPVGSSNSMSVAKVGKDHATTALPSCLPIPFLTWRRASKSMGQLPSPDGRGRSPSSSKNSVCTPRGGGGGPPPGNPNGSEQRPRSILRRAPHHADEDAGGGDVEQCPVNSSLSRRRHTSQVRFDPTISVARLSFAELKETSPKASSRRRPASCNNSNRKVNFSDDDPSSSATARPKFIACRQPDAGSRQELGSSDEIGM